MPIPKSMSKSPNPPKVKARYFYISYQFKKGKYENGIGSVFHANLNGDDFNMIEFIEYMKIDNGLEVVIVLFIKELTDEEIALFLETQKEADA